MPRSEQHRHASEIHELSETYLRHVRRRPSQPRMTMLELVEAARLAKQLHEMTELNLRAIEGWIELARSEP